MGGGRGPIKTNWRTKTNNGSEVGQLLKAGEIIASDDGDWLQHDHIVMLTDMKIDFTSDMSNSVDTLKMFKDLSLPVTGMQNNNNNTESSTMIKREALLGGGEELGYTRWNSAPGLMSTGLKNYVNNLQYGLLNAVGIGVRIKKKGDTATLVGNAGSKTGDVVEHKTLSDNGLCVRNEDGTKSNRTLGDVVSPFAQTQAIVQDSRLITDFCGNNLPVNMRDYSINKMVIKNPKLIKVSDREQGSSDGELPKRRLVNIDTVLESNLPANAVSNSHPTNDDRDKVVGDI